MDVRLPDTDGARLNVYEPPWDLNVDWCPCDVHFNEFVADRISNAAIFHFGTGNHHVVGIDAALNGRNNAVLAITASVGEYESYIKLVIERPEVGRVYKVLFGDIYQLDGRLLPALDVITLFHLCEFRSEVQDAYGALTDRELVELMIEKLEPGGHILLYKDSLAFDKAEPLIAELLKDQAPIRREPDYQTLQVYRRL
jgi:hypothetical protein